MGSLERDVVRILIAGIALTALYDVLAINKGQSAIGLTKALFGGYGAILARGSGQRPPTGF